VDAGVGLELVEPVEAPDVADLRHERGAGRRADGRDRPQLARQIAIEERRDVRIRLLDLALEQVELIEQQADLERHLGLELGHRDRFPRRGLEALRLRLVQAPVPGAPGSRRRASPAGGP